MIKNRKQKALIENIIEFEFRENRDRSSSDLQEQHIDRNMNFLESI